MEIALAFEVVAMHASQASGGQLNVSYGQTVPCTVLEARQLKPRKLPDRGTAKSRRCGPEADDRS
jgi:hypothetical protein